VTGRAAGSPRNGPTRCAPGSRPTRGHQDNGDEIWLEVGHERFKVGGESLEGSKRTEALARIAAISPRIGAYQEKTDREIPIVRLIRETA
jgi:hypothetical protein